MTFRIYDRERDEKAVLRIYKEVGWVAEKSHEKAMKQLTESGHGLVAELHGEAECYVMSERALLRHCDTDLPLCAVTGVTTSRIARKRGLAGRLTARLMADAARDGQAVAMLGIFEQGYYNQLGFGNGSYEHWCRVDPAHLKVEAKADVPVRLSNDDWQSMHENRLTRLQPHGACSILSPTITEADVLWSDNGFGFGYLDESGALTHHIWCSAKGEHGPYRVNWMAYRTREQFLELMALIKSLEEQVRSISLREPPGIQLQDFIHAPFRLRMTTRRSEHENYMSAAAYWQARILDLETCVAAVTLDGKPAQFNLQLTDPIERYFDVSDAWRGVAGDYVITLGSESSATPGTNAGLPTLKTTVNAFTRLWMGVRSASNLSWTDDLQGPPELLAQLDAALRLPNPLPDWDF